MHKSVRSHVLDFYFNLRSCNFSDNLSTSCNSSSHSFWSKSWNCLKMIWKTHTAYFFISTYFATCLIRVAPSGFCCHQSDFLCSWILCSWILCSWILCSWLFPNWASRASGYCKMLEKGTKLQVQLLILNVTEYWVNLSLKKVLNYKCIYLCFFQSNSITSLSTWNHFLKTKFLL